MAEDVGRDVLDVLGHDVAAAREERARAVARSASVARGEAPYDTKSARSDRP